MQTELNHTVKSLFGKESLDDLSREDLLLLTTKYPYAAIFHFLYTRKLQSVQDFRFPASVAKTALYFSNPHWLNNQLRAKTSVEALAEMEMAFEKSHAAIAENDVNNFVQSNEREEENDYQLEKEIRLEPFPETDTDLPENPIENFDYTREETPDLTDQTINEVEENNIPDEQIQTEPDYLTTENKLDIPNELAEEKFEFSEPVIDFPAAIEETIPEVLKPEIFTEIIESETIKEISAPIIEEQINVVTHPTEKSEQEILEIPLEPLYAVDYFASQGIRIREEDQQDQLGKKLKSFTEWLKSMKKVHPEKSTVQIDEKTEAAIKSDAEQSNDKSEVLTETMAEVFIKQGLIQKALEVYQKLSLLDPDKSATFAAKISELKAKET
jgi:hypothetical protein